MERLEKIFHQKMVVQRTFDCLPLTAELLGGAPRDWYFGNPAKDLDFFMREDILLNRGVEIWEYALKNWLGGAFTFTEANSVKPALTNSLIPFEYSQLAKLICCTMA